MKKKTFKNSITVPTMVQSLSQWYEKKHRPLPWRKTLDPYSIWISEVMLQQTQVATVIPYYERFLKSFPTLAHLAKAPLEKVLEHWSGLGYYSRARNLQKGAQYLVKNHGELFPKTREAILEVPGIGPYTAGAILSIAFDLKVPIVDGNVQRVLTRFYGWKKILESKETQSWLWQESEKWVGYADSPRVLNQALMELGATLCRKQNPSCDQCPLQKACYASAHQNANQFPFRRPRHSKVEKYFIAVVLQHKEKVFLQKIPKGQWWEGLYSVPLIASEMDSIEKDLEEISQSLELSKRSDLGKIQHTVTHHSLQVMPTVFTLKKPPLELKQKLLTGEWTELKKAHESALSSLSRKVLRQLES